MGGQDRVTFLPAVARGAQDPVLAVVKVDAAVWGKKAWASSPDKGRRSSGAAGDQAVRVVDRVEAWGSTGLREGPLGGAGGRGTAPPMRRSLGCSGATSRKLKGDTSLHMRRRRPGRRGLWG